MDDLFTSEDVLRPVTLEGAEVNYLRRFHFGMDVDEMLQGLIAETPWRQEKVTLWGKRFEQPRLVAWYGDIGRAYSYSGVSLEPLPWTERLNAVKMRLEALVRYQFNSVLLNYYRDQNDSMGLHSDDEKELGPNPVIASVSLGAERAFLFKSRRVSGAKTVKLPLASGSLLLMKGETQSNYKHGIAKETKQLGPRINMTFRLIVST